MPFIYDFENIEWPEDRGDDYWPEPAPEEYQYLKPEEFGGAASPVRFEVPQQLLSISIDQRPAAPKRGLFSRFFRAIVGTTKAGRTMISISDAMSSVSGRSARQQERQKNLFFVVIPAIRRIGGLEVTCAYDGGNDEGFAWFHSLRTADSVLDKAQLASRLAASGLVPVLREAKLLYESSGNARTDVQHIEEVLESLAEEWGSLLLGSGFGAGPYQMYGSFIADLGACTITDDPQATPVAGGNIRFPAHSEDDSREQN